MPNFLKKDLDKANVVSPYFTQLLFSSISYVPLSNFGKQDFSKLRLDRLQKENLLLSVWGQEGGTEVVKGFKSYFTIIDNNMMYRYVLENKK